MENVLFQNGDGFINRQELGYVMDNLGLQMDKDEIEVDFEIIFDPPVSLFHIRMKGYNHISGFRGSLMRLTLMEMGR